MGLGRCPWGSYGAGGVCGAVACGAVTGLGASVGQLLVGQLWGWRIYGAVARGAVVGLGGFMGQLVVGLGG